MMNKGEGNELGAAQTNKTSGAAANNLDGGGKKSNDPQEIPTKPFSSEELKKAEKKAINNIEGRGGGDKGSSSPKQYPNICLPKKKS